MSIQIATTENFDQLIANGLTLVDFYADWCGPCKMLAPVLEQLANEITDVNIIKLNVDHSREIAQRFGVMSIPTIILFKDGNQIAQTVGFQPKERLKVWIDSNK